MSVGPLHMALYDAGYQSENSILNEMYFFNYLNINKYKQCLNL